MLTLILTAALSVPSAAATTPMAVAFPTPATTRQDPGKDALKALTAWLKLYRKGKIDYRSEEDNTKHSIAVKYKLRSAGDLGNSTWAGDLRLILTAVARRNDAEAARALGEVAAIGLDDGNYTYAMAPYSVRAAALEQIAKLTGHDAKEALAAGARGEWKTRRGAVALRCGALVALGHVRDEAYEPVAVAALSDGNPMVRIHAVEALRLFGSETAAMALVGVVEREGDDGVLVTAAKALRSIYGKYLREVRDAAPVGNSDDKAASTSDKSMPEPPASARLAVRAAAKALGRTTWRADMVLVRLLDDFRSAEAVPALIAALERFRDNPNDLKTGKSSTLLKFRVHELLVSMTGAVYSADQPDKWRELWEREKDKIQVAKRNPVPKSGGTSAAGFVGIPVEGSRVVFILDLSGSMEWPMNDGTGRMRRIDYAKRELLKAVDGLAPNAMFNLVTFNGDTEAEAWSKKLVPANDRNRRRFRKFVEKLRPLGGTNLWAGLEKALNIKSLQFGDHYETTVDEIFLLSDGAPSVGDVIDPIEILRLTHEINRFKEVRINTVFISSETPPQVMAMQRQMSLSPAELMKRMARENGGRFRDV